MGRVALIAVAAVMLAACGGGNGKRRAACEGKPDFTHYVIYRARGRGGATVSPAALDATVKAVCERARRSGIPGVSVQRAGADRIKVGGADPPPRSLAAAGKLAFYDWEPNLLPPKQIQPTLRLFDAARAASRQRPRSEAVDVPDDRRNDTAGVKYYAFGRDGQPLPAPMRGANPADAYYDTRPGRGVVVRVPRGIVILRDESHGSGKPSLGYWTLEDDAELTAADIKDPKQQFDPQTTEPIVTFLFTERGRAAFARVTLREAKRGARLPSRAPRDNFQRFAIALDNQLVSLAVIDHRANPEGISGDTGAQINGIGNLRDTQELARNLAARPLPLDLVPVGSR